VDTNPQQPVQFDALPQTP